MSKQKIKVGDTVLVRARVVKINEGWGAPYLVNFSESFATTADVFANVYEKAVYLIDQATGSKPHVPNPPTPQTTAEDSEQTGERDA